LKEVDYAASLNKRFAPIVCRRLADDAVPEPLRRLNFIFFDDLAVFETGADRLAEALHTDIGWIRQHTDFGEAARRWTAAGRPGGLLLRSPVLDEAERWIASRPRGAPEPTAETQTYVIESRRGTSRRRNILTGSLAAGLVVALALAGVAYWQRGIAVEQRQIAEQQRKRAEDTLAAATETANSLVFDLAQRFRDTVGVPAALVKDILDRAIALQKQLVASGQTTPGVLLNGSAALDESARTFLVIGDTEGALAAAEAARQIDDDLLRSGDCVTVCLDRLSVTYLRLGDAMLEMGKREDALAVYRKSLTIAALLAASDKTNTRWQRNLANGHERIGDALLKAGKLKDALTSYQNGLDIRQRLADSDKSNTEWQHDLSIGIDKVADLLGLLGRRHDALAQYWSALAIRRQLADSNKNNALWQRDVVVSYLKIGDLLNADGQREQAFAAYQRSLAVIQQLADSDKDNTSWQQPGEGRRCTIGLRQAGRSAGPVPEQPHHLSAA
jgi:tetratricopeptide (TPR) repeat protein